LARCQFVIITGLSGAGKTFASRCFEDLGYFCVDNLPPALLPKFAQLCDSSEITQAALVIDIRGRDFFNDLLSALDELHTDEVAFRVVFLDASDKVLVRRFSETRRKHPLASAGGRVLDAISTERALLESIKARADIIIDSSDLKPGQLKTAITTSLNHMGSSPVMAINIMSFGFKYGLPVDADMVLDVRFLANPYYVPELRNLTGNDEDVQRYVLKQPPAKQFLVHTTALIDFLLPRYQAEGKSQFTLAIGCTGGKHRSITMANELARYLEDKRIDVSLEHRDIRR
jgi:RNase adapter protein RapZ